METLYTVAFPSISDEAMAQIDVVRGQYDADFREMVAPHYTLIFACDALSEADYLKHVSHIARSRAPIRFVCRYVMLSSDGANDNAYAFLVPDEGYSGLSRLHDALYIGPMSDHLRLDLPYIPHITLGRFTNHAQAKRVCDELNANGVIVTGEIKALSVGLIASGRFATLSNFALSGFA